MQLKHHSCSVEQTASKGSTFDGLGSQTSLVTTLLLQKYTERLLYYSYYTQDLSFRSAARQRVKIEQAARSQIGVPLKVPIFCPERYAAIAYWRNIILINAFLRSAYFECIAYYRVFSVEHREFPGMLGSTRLNY